jgi:polysaccharide pyruvyl transferase WcaK-like protein
VKFLYIKGVHFENKGAELMMQTIIQKIKDDNKYRVVLAANSATPFEKRCEVGAYQYFSLSFGRFDLNQLTYLLPEKLTKWLTKTYGIVLEPELYAILDASGYAYGDKWPLRGLQRTCGQLKRLFKHSKKYIFMPQMLGPFQNNDSRTLVKDNFKYASLIVARENTSLACVTDIIGKSENLIVGPDFTNLLQVELNIRDKNKLLIIPNSNMVSERSGHGDWKAKYMGIFEELINAALAKGFNVSVLNHEDKSDQPICEQLAKMYAGKVDLIQDYDALQIKKAISTAGFVVSSRFHGCVSALSQGVACIGTSWSHKYEELYNDYAASNLLISKPDQIENYTEFFNHIVDNQNDIEKIIAGKSLNIKAESKKVWSVIQSKLAN